MKQRLLWADLMKIIAICGVILLHVSASYLVPFDASRHWWIGNFYDAFSRWCVPLFVMVSGALLLPNAGQRPLRRFFLVRVRRVLIPFLVWSAIYYGYRMYVKGDDLTPAGFFPMVVTEPVYYHLWFIYMLIVLYLFAPAAGIFLQRSPEKYVWYLIGLWFFWTSLLPILDTPMEAPLYFSPELSDYSALRLSGYFLLGYLLREWSARSGRGVAGLVLAFLMAGGGTMLGTYFMSEASGGFHPFFYNYFSITVVVMTVSLFLTIKSLFNEVDAVTLFRKIGTSVFGVYLTHALVLEVLRDGLLGFTIDHSRLLGIEIPLVAGIPLFSTVIFFTSLLPVLMIRTIPVLKDGLT